MITILAFVFVLGVLVFVHELGHFLAAKRVGIRVLKFQLGFNPTVLSFRRGDTEYGIGALPLGGYVKMAGENPEDVEHDERGNEIKRPDEFLSKTKWERFQVLIMGPIMNLLLAVVLTAVVLHQGVEKDGLRGSAGRRRRRDGGIRGGEGGHSTRRSDRVRRGPHRRHVGPVPDGGGDEAEPRDLDRPAAQWPRADAHGDPDAAGRPEPVRDRRHRRASERAPAVAVRDAERTGRSRRTESGRRDRRRRRSAR